MLHNLFYDEWKYGQNSRRAFLKAGLLEGICFYPCELDLFPAHPEQGNVVVLMLIFRMAKKRVLLATSIGHFRNLLKIEAEK